MRKISKVVAIMALIAVLGLSLTGCGSTGVAGDTGATGVAGDTGVQGVQGIQGEAGPTGLQGEAGSQGEQGIQGEVGLMGLQGEQGVPGVRGLTGFTGYAGAAGADGVDGAQSLLFLSSKDATSWEITNSMGAVLLFQPASPKFLGSLTAWGLESGIDYSLIYYADQDSRWVNWGGNNPGVLIATGWSDGVGDLVLHIATNLGMNLPHPDDANCAVAGLYNYSLAPDYYMHATGAKLWLVPSVCYDDGLAKVTSWQPTRFLFETDLITYEDTDN